MLPAEFFGRDRVAYARECIIRTRVPSLELAPRIIGHEEEGGIRLRQKRDIVRGRYRSVRLDRAARLAYDLADDAKCFTDRHGQPERHREPRRDAPDALMENRPSHRLVEQRGHDAAVHRPVPSLVAALRYAARLGAPARHVEIQVQSAVVETATREAPMLEVDAELGELHH